MEVFEVFPIVSLRGMSTGIPIFGPQNRSKSRKNCCKLLRDEFPPLLGGDLNPVSGFYFPLFSMVFPSEIAISVESGGFSRKQNCCKLLQVYVHFVGGLYLIKS